MKDDIGTAKEGKREKRKEGRERRKMLRKGRIEPGGPRKSWT